LSGLAIASITGCFGDVNCQDLPSEASQDVLEFCDDDGKATLAIQAKLC